MTTLIVNPIAPIKQTKEVFVSPDKSLSHRALLLASLANGQSCIENILLGTDCLATLNACRSLGIHIAVEKNACIVNGKGFEALVEPSHILNCDNSGTTMRLLIGALSAAPFYTFLTGTDQLCSRPMDRVIDPLIKMGAKIWARNNCTKAPIAIAPSKLVAGSFALAQKSAQVKSALLLAGLFARQKVSVQKIAGTRDHTENLLQSMGALIERRDDEVSINPLNSDLKTIDITIPGDISSAAFYIALGVLKADHLIIKEVSLNKTRIGLLNALKKMKADITLENIKTSHNEIYGDIHIKRSKLVGATFEKDEITLMIDEIPILALIATQAFGTTIIKDASELKVKETNRIVTTAKVLGSMGANITVLEDGLEISGNTNLNGANISSYSDHRIAMMGTIAALLANGPSKINDAHVYKDSFPKFVEGLQMIGANISEIDQ